MIFFNGPFTCSLTLKDFYSRPPAHCKFIMTNLVPRSIASLEVERRRLKAKLRVNCALGKLIIQVKPLCKNHCLAAKTWRCIIITSIWENGDRVLHWSTVIILNWKKRIFQIPTMVQDKWSYPLWVASRYKRSKMFLWLRLFST